MGGGGNFKIFAWNFWLELKHISKAIYTMPLK